MSTSSIDSSAGSTAPVVSVASSSSADAAGGSVINVSSLVQQLVTATQAPQEALISSQTQQVSAQISALGWRTREPDPLPAEQPTFVPKLVRAAITAAGGQEGAARAAGTTAQALRILAGDPGPGQEEAS